MNNCGQKALKRENLRQTSSPIDSWLKAYQLKGILLYGYYIFLGVSALFAVCICPLFHRWKIVKVKSIPGTLIRDLSHEAIMGGM